MPGLSGGQCSPSPRNVTSRPLPDNLKGLFAMLFVEIFGASLTIPVFTYFCIVELGLSSTYVGMVMSGFSFAQLLGAPIVGRLSDAHGRRPALLGCFLWTAVCFLATAGVRSFLELFAIRTLAGLSGGSIPVTQAMVMDIAHPEERPAVLGVMGALLGVAFTLGPGTVTLLLFVYGLPRRLVFLAAAACALVGCGVGLCVLRETLPQEKRRPLCVEKPDCEERSCEGTVCETWSLCTPGLVSVWVGRFCSSFAFLCLFTTYAFLIRDAFGWGDREFGLVLAFSGLLGAGVQLSVYPLLSRCWGKHGVFVFGCSLVALYFVCLPLFTVVYRCKVCHLMSKALFIVGAAVIDPGVPDLVGFYAPEDQMGLAQGITNAFRSLASVAAPLAAGATYDVSPYHVYALASAMALLGGGFVGLAPTLAGTWGSQYGGKAQPGELHWLLRKERQDTYPPQLRG